MLKKTKILGYFENYHHIHQNRCVICGMKKILLAIIVSLGFLSANSQNYTTALGARFGGGLGMTLRQVVAPGWSVEGILSYKRAALSTNYALLAQHHRKLLGRRLNFYFGAGIQGASFEILEPDSPKNPFGIAGVVGLDFTIKRLNLSFDFQPHYNLKGGTRDFTSSSGLSLRYVLIKRIKPKKRNKGNWKFWEKDKKKSRKKKKKS